MYKIGFACKYMHFDQMLPKKELKEIEGSFNTRAVTLKWLRSVTNTYAEERLFEIIEHNLQSQLKLLRYVNSLPDNLKMVRISSDLLPLYTHPEFAYFYNIPAFRKFIEDGFSAIGEYARSQKIRLSMHPGQFCVLASDRDDVVERSLQEFEYHADMIRMMGYGKKFQDFKCNIHISGAIGVEGILKIWPRLSEVAKNTITFENEERKYGLDECLQVSHLCPVVLDIHHCWINEGEYIDREDDRLKRVVESWRGVRPTMHYSQSKEILIDAGISTVDKINMDETLKYFNKKDLCAHSHRMWNDWCNQYAKTFLDEFDIMFEVKHKNIAVIEYYNRYLKNA